MPSRSITTIEQGGSTVGNQPFWIDNEVNRIANRIGALIIQHWFIFAPKWLFLNHAFVNLSRRSVHCDHALQFDFDLSDLFDLLPGRNLAIIKT